MNKASIGRRGRVYPGSGTSIYHSGRGGARICFLIGLMVAVWAWPAWAQASVVINEIHCNPDDEAERVEFIELYNAGDEAVDLSGWYFDAGLTYVFPAGTILAAQDYVIVAEDPDQIHLKWGSGRIDLDPNAVLGPYEGRLDNDGDRILLCDAVGQEVDEVEYGLGFPWPTVGSALDDDVPGSGASMQLVNPAFDNNVPVNWLSAEPTPLEVNGKAYRTNVGPFARNLTCEPQQPASDQPVTVTVEVTDADGVIGVALMYQVVSPGHYIPAKLPVALSTLATNPNAEPLRNPDYYDAANWTQVYMLDDGTGGDVTAGDGVYTTVIPGQAHRTLVRFRFQAMDMLGAATNAPYADDLALNFAYFVYDGVPDYEGFSSEMLQSLPVHHLLTRAEDMRQTLGYSSSDQIPQFYNGVSNPARFVYNWYGTFVYDGVVYDNIRYRLRGANGRYLGGNSKRSMRFRFNRGHYFQAKDAQGQPYPTKWRTLTTAKGFDNRQTLTYAFNEYVNFYLFEKMGIPAPYAYYFHFRVIDDENEAPDAWRGDFWGLGFAQETYDVRFLEAHDLEKGNLYKLINSTTDAKEQQRYQGPFAVTDGSDHDNIENRLSGYSTPDFVRAHVRLDKWYAYHALAQAIRHYDFWPSANKNATWYFEPVYTAANSYLGLMWTLPWDTDATWGPTWNDGYDVVYNSIFACSGGGADSRSNPELQPDYYAAVRGVRDLLWQRDQIASLLAEMAEPIADFVEADRVRWLNAPSDAGNYRSLSGAGKNGLDAFVEDMLDFAFEGGSWPGGSVGTGGRAAFLDSLADDEEGDLIPEKPTITNIGEPDYPTNALYFQRSVFDDPQGSGTFAATHWRIAEVSPDAQPGLDPDVSGSVFVPDEAQWRYFKGITEPPSGWREQGFDDSNWLTGQSPIGYGEDFIATVLDEMPGRYTTVYLRKSFDVTDPEAFDALDLEVMYDDGVNVWINGVLAVQENMTSANLSHSGTAASTQEYTSFVSFTLDDPAAYLVAGQNVIAVQVANASLSSSSDCFVDVRLTGHEQTGDDPSDEIRPGQGTYEIETLWESQTLSQSENEIRIPASVVETGRTYRVRCRVQDSTGRWSHWSAPIQFEAGSPVMTGLLAGLRITEVMYNPPGMPQDGAFDNDEFEFIELKNIGQDVLDLSSLSFTDGITFDFQNSYITTLAPGAFALVVRNADAFTLRYGTGISEALAGQYEGKLANEGESLKLVDFWEGTIVEFQYQDEPGWPLAADGDGYSLVPLESALAGEPNGSLNDGAHWRASAEIGGSPGYDDP